MKIKLISFLCIMIILKLKNKNGMNEVNEWSDVFEINV